MNIPEETDMNYMGWNDMTEKKTVSENLHGVTKQSSPHYYIVISKMRGLHGRVNQER